MSRGWMIPPSTSIFALTHGQAITSSHTNTEGDTSWRCPMTDWQIKLQQASRETRQKAKEWLCRQQAENIFKTGCANVSATPNTSTGLR